MPATMSPRQKNYVDVKEEQMKKRFSKILSLMLAAVVAFGTIGISTSGAYAVSHKWTIGCQDYIWKGDSIYVSVYDQINDYADAQVTKVVSSNKNIKVIKNKDGSDVWFNLKGKKIGKAKITVYFKAPGSSTVKHKSKTIRVKAYPNEIESLKVCGKSVKISSNKFNYHVYEYKKTSPSVKLALKKGWKIDSIYAYAYTKSGAEKKMKITKKMLKNGTAFSLAKKYRDLYIDIGMIKGDDYSNYISYFIGIHR